VAFFFAHLLSDCTWILHSPGLENKRAAHPVLASKGGPDQLADHQTEDWHYKTLPTQESLLGNEHALQSIRTDARSKAQSSPWRDSSHVPQKTHVLQAHQSHTCYASNCQH